MRELPSPAWERFQADSDKAVLVAVVRSLPIRKPLQDADYPEYHRLCDIELAGQGFRVSRLVDVDDGQERLFIEPIAAPEPEKPGVPSWLRGEALLRWVRDETAFPTKGEIDWEAYRS